MELNITTTEFILFIWAAIATGAAAKYYEEVKHAKLLLTIFIEDEGARTQILKARDEFKRRMQERKP
jgi:hypothetical protein